MDSKELFYMKWREASSPSFLYLLMNTAEIPPHGV